MKTLFLIKLLRKLVDINNQLYRVQFCLSSDRMFLGKRNGEGHKGHVTKALYNLYRRKLALKISIVFN